MKDKRFYVHDAIRSLLLTRVKDLPIRRLQAASLDLEPYEMIKRLNTIGWLVPDSESEFLDYLSECLISKEKCIVFTSTDEQRDEVEKLSGNEENIFVMKSQFSELPVLGADAGDIAFIYVMDGSKVLADEQTSHNFYSWVVELKLPNVIVVLLN
jgi:hypothetical protein